MRQRQIKLSPQGLWHRPFDGNGGDHTACGEPIGIAVAIRDHTLDLDLCPLCWTARERDTAKMKRLEREALERASSEAWFDDDLDKTPTEITVIPNDHERKERK